MEILQAINISSIAILAVIGTFVVFRLQWLRRELDDYRGRIISILRLELDGHATLSTPNQAMLSNIKNYSEKVRIKERDEYLAMVDDVFEQDILNIFELNPEFRKIKHEIPKPNNQGPFVITTLGGSFDLFQRRLNQRRSVLIFFKKILIILLLSFLLTMFLGNLNAITKVILGGVYGIVLLAIFKWLYEILKNDY